MSAKYYLYRNLRTGGFSIKHHGRVCERSNFVVMTNATLKVNKAGQERVRKEKAKNVHAYVVADNYTTPVNLMWKQNKMIPVTYNPYEHDTFVNAKTGEPIHEAKYAIARNGRLWVEV